MYACHHYFWRLGRSTCMAGVNMNEEVKAGEWIGKHLFAFPANHYDLADSEHGLTMRDYFAAKAMQALIAHEQKASHLSGANIGDFDVRVAFAAYRYADAMVERKNK
jgi:hypothetical protein